MPDDAPWMNIAKAEIGQQEKAGDEHNPRVLEYLATCGTQFKTDETPWCSAFANWTMIHAGKKGTNSALARSWLKWGEPIEEPRYGCVVVFKRGTSNWQGHVGFFVRAEGEQDRRPGGQPVQHRLHRPSLQIRPPRLPLAGAEGLTGGSHL